MGNTKESMNRLMEVDGAIGCCLVDSTSGMVLAEAGGAGFNLEVAAAGNTEVVRAKRRTIKTLDLNDAVEDILITLGRQYHLIRLLPNNDSLFIYFVLDKSRANLAMSRHVVGDVAKNVSL